MGQAKNNKLNAANKYAAIDSIFRDRQIDLSKPGFYDHPAFIELEKADQFMPEKYAAWVRDKGYEPEYLQKVRDMLPRFCEILADRLEAERRIGYCKDITLTAGRFLDRLGIWNYPISGSFTVSLTEHPSLGRRYLKLIDVLADQGGVTGHYWLAVPPFKVVDVAARLQNWDAAEFRTIIPKVITAEAGEWFTAREGDIIAPDVPASTLARFRRQILDLPRFQREGFHALRIDSGSTRMDYVPQGIVFSYEGIEGIGIGKGGMPAVPLWNDWIAPEFGVAPIKME